MGPRGGMGEKNLLILQSSVWFFSGGQVLFSLLKIEMEHRI